MGNVIRVLLVDDDPSVADLTATYLKRTSDRIETFVETCPAEALDRVTHDERIDCIVSDYEMPAMNGLELLDEVRAVASDLPFILFTGRGSEEIASEAVSAGVTDYLQKETGVEQYEVLANRVENAVGQYRAEQEADEANEQIRRILGRITDAFFALDDEWRITYANQQAAAHTDYTQEELVDEEIQSVLSESDSDGFYDAFEWAFESQESVTLEIESVFQSDGWVEIRIYPSKDGLSVYFRDVTERKRAQDELRETKQKIEALHDIAAQAVSCTTEQDIYDLGIEAAEEILALDLCTIDAYEDGMLVPQAVSKGVPTDGYYDTTPVETEHNLAARAYRHGESSLVRDLRETDVVPAESEYRSALTVPLGEYGAFQAVSEEPGGFDDDDRELAELLAAHLSEALARVQSEAELRAERDRFAVLFENVPNAVVRYDINDGEAICKTVNPAFEDEFGWNAEEIVGKPVDDYIVPDDHRDEGESLNEQVRSGKRIEGAEVYRQTCEGGRDFLLHTAPPGDGDTTESFAIYVDITEQKERERKLARQNKRLEEFASVVSHDLRNPLNVARGRFDLLDEEFDSEHLPPIGRSLDRMDSLVEDLLALARQGQVVAETEPVRLSTAATKAWEMAETKAGSLSLADDLVVEADDARFRELLENLFHNAVEHADSAVTVEVGTLEDQTGFYVEDDGPGIPDDVNEQIFDHGFTTADDGTGFGLAIVDSIADAHGWSVELCEGEAGGARFEFSRATVWDDDKTAC